MVIGALGPLALGLSACSLAPTPASVTLDERTPPDPRRDPPGAALPLSIGGPMPLLASDDRDTAIHCAAALGLTAERLASLSDNPRRSEIAVMRQAEDFFVASAQGSQASPGEADLRVQRAIERHQSEKRDEVAGQAQLAIACLRRFGESAVVAQT